MAASAAKAGHNEGLFYGLAGLAGLFGVGLIVFGLLYIGLGEICDHISISANNSRVAARRTVYHRTRCLPSLPGALRLGLVAYQVGGRGRHATTFLQRTEYRCGDLCGVHLATLRCR